MDSDSLQQCFLQAMDSASGDSGVPGPAAVVALTERLAASLSGMRVAPPMDRLADLFRSDPESLSASYETWLANIGGDDPSSATGGADRRKRQGAYFTPPRLIDSLLDAVLPTEWILERKVQSGGMGPVICDPSCGTGNFLVAAAERIRRAIAGNKRGGKFVDETLRRTICERLIHGFDIDGGALAIARLRLWHWAGKPATSLSEFAPGLQVANSLLDDLPNARFDAVVGNPPFANAIEGRIDTRIQAERSSRFADLAGTADLSFYFASLSHRLARATGRVGLVLPRNFLTARSAENLRRRLLTERPPMWIHLPSSPLHFHSANVFVALIAFDKSPCVVRREDAAGRIAFERTVEIATSNWWAQTMPACTRRCDRETSGQLSDRFEVFASMTAGMGYELREFVAEGEPDDECRLITTGLIEPGRSEWGLRPCRYLKQRYRRPVIRLSERMPAGLRTRLRKIRRPKVLVAGLSNRIEALLDRTGSLTGAVSTFTILSPSDDLAALERICEFLNSAAATEMLQEQLGANAMGGGRITLNKHFLRELPLPAPILGRRRAA